MPLISIIVPVYKVEIFLDRCICSVLAQTFTDFELILVDDGSPDRCGALCDEWAKKDNRIVVLHKKNGGLSDARNAGIEIAVGDFLGFVDSDDYVEKDMFEFLFKNMQDTNADISCCGFYDCYEGRSPERRMVPYSALVTTEKAIELVLSGQAFTVNVWNKLYRREIFSTLRFPVGKIMEDGYLIVESLLRAKSIFISTEPKYYYLHRDGSITKSRFTERELHTIESSVYNYQLVLEKFPLIIDAASVRLMWSYRYVLEQLSLADKSAWVEHKDIITLCKKNIRRYMSSCLVNRYISAVKKMVYALICVSPSSYMRLFKIRQQFFFKK